MNGRSNVALAAAAGLSTVFVGGNMLWQRTSARAVRALERRQPRSPAEPLVIASTEFSGLPPVVARYFTFALSPGQHTVEHACFSQRGDMRSGARAPWKTFEAQEDFSTHPIGFAWDASMAMLPFIPIRIRDGYIGGAGSSEAKLAATISLGKLAGTPEVAAASLVRYLAEIVWLPTALLPRCGVTWTSTSDCSARATLTDAGVTVSIEFEFGSNAQIVRASTMRSRAVGKSVVLTRWIGSYRDYRRIEGMMIPMEAEVSWSPPEGEFAVWRSRITDARYRFSTYDEKRVPSSTRP